MDISYPGGLAFHPVFLLQSEPGHDGDRYFFYGDQLSDDIKENEHKKLCPDTGLLLFRHPAPGLDAECKFKGLCNRKPSSHRCL